MLVLKENKVPEAFLKGHGGKRQGMASGLGRVRTMGSMVRGCSGWLPAHTAAARSKRNNGINMKSSNSIWLLLHYTNLLIFFFLIKSKIFESFFKRASLMHSHFWMHCVEAVENPNRNCWCHLKQDYAHMTDSPSQLSKEQCKSLLIDFYKSIMLKRQQTSTSHSRIPVWLPGLQGSRWTWALVSQAMPPPPMLVATDPAGLIALRAASLCSPSPSFRTEQDPPAQEAGSW